jgi:hypothetical protein
MAKFPLSTDDFGSGANTNGTDAHVRPIWGAKDIAREIGRTERQAFHLLESGQLLGARKIGGKWVITRAMLRLIFEGAADAPRTP